MEDLFGFMDDLASDNLGSVYGRFKNRWHADKILFEARTFLPRNDDEWLLSFKHGQGKEVTLAPGVIQRINDWFQQDVARDAIKTVTGELIAVDFVRHILSLKYPPTDKIIESASKKHLSCPWLDKHRHFCSYNEEFRRSRQRWPFNGA